MKKLVLTDGRYEYDGKTRNVSVTEEELHKAGYMKLADDERIYKKVELPENEAEFMKDNKCLVFYHPQATDFEYKANEYADKHAKNLEDKSKIYNRLVWAYFYGYTVVEQQYYIQIPITIFGSNTDCWYLNVDLDNDKWRFAINSYRHFGYANKFTQEEIDKLQKDEQAKGMDLNALKVKVPDNEPAD
ncbi:MAG: hypothetical protein MRZ40_02635 [Ligilactobacillus animalis]|uniref:hypothetical protein n=1 Tax=Ligilactobacillus animalis TaxID=1605 RepID=UPI00242DB243|nr:hypothetical protein [Ligilactobacillus animalis]MCI5941449.1 hypothetical protein [Ligilactobacillus animalis]MDY2992967.1 hypothetical protein [Ligilactobacillus animalis]